MERELAVELIDHIWQQKLDEPQFKEVVQRIFRDAGQLQWYSLLRPFDRIAKIRNFVPELQTIVMRVANLVAKADGTVSAEETAMLHTIQREIEVHLCRIRLDEPDPSDAAVAFPGGDSDSASRTGAAQDPRPVARHVAARTVSTIRFVCRSRAC